MPMSRNCKTRPERPSCGPETTSTSRPMSCSLFTDVLTPLRALVHFGVHAGVVAVLAHVFRRRRCGLLNLVYVLDKFQVRAVMHDLFPAMPCALNRTELLHLSVGQGIDRRHDLGRRFLLVVLDDCGGLLVFFEQDRMPSLTVNGVLVLFGCGLLPHVVL